jgi:glutamine amidotransferase
MITIVDYGVGNTAALVNIYDDLGLESEISHDPHVIACANKLILPGVGAYDKAMTTLRAKDLIAPLEHAVLGRGVPIMGICLGMQLLGRRSEEGVEQGLGWIPADVVRISAPPDSGLKVPHIGWAGVQPVKVSTLFPSAVYEPERFYFVHSYYVRCDRCEDVAAVINYGCEICCAVSCRNIYGVQFHPEKSHRFGRRLLRDFAAGEEFGIS